MAFTKPFKLPSLPVPQERCYWVVENRFLAGAYPGHSDAQAHKKRISLLWESGMRTFINLMEEGETNHTGKAFVRYDDVLRDMASKVNDRIAHLRFPVPDTKIPTVDRMRSILDAIDLSILNHAPVYLHCFGGMGRTGTVVCCWLLRHGLATKENVLSLLTTLRQADLQRASWPAPENDIQRQFVMDWMESQSANTTRPTQSPSGKETDAFRTNAKPTAATSEGNWFERLFGFTESGRKSVYAELEVDGINLKSKKSGAAWGCGELEIVSLADLRKRTKDLRENGSETILQDKVTSPIKVSELIGNAKTLHADASSAGALFQVASQFNLLEMISPTVTPEQGITIYAGDPTQGPACAIACAAGTVYRNYFVQLNGQVGQTAHQQVDCLAAIGNAFGNANSRLWQMKNGYALPSPEGLEEIDRKLSSMSESDLDELRGLLKIGLQWDTQVTLDGCDHKVTQAYCSALPVAYSGLSPRSWERFARLILESAYEATLSAAALNAVKHGNNVVFLTLLGGGAFGNDQAWILDAIRRAVRMYKEVDLDVKIVSFGQSKPAIRQLCDSFLA